MHFCGVGAPQWAGVIGSPCTQARLVFFYPASPTLLASLAYSFTVALTSKQYAALLAAYGAAEAPLTSLEACRECKVEGSLLSERRKREKERILQVSVRACGDRRDGGGTSCCV